MLVFLSMCLAFAWDLPTGNPVSYNLYLDGNTEEVYYPNAIPGQQLCFHDDQPHTIAVAGVDMYGDEGPLSDWSDSVQMMFEAPIWVVNPRDAARADFNGKMGWDDSPSSVDGADFGAFVQVFGTTGVHCPKDAPCQ